MPNEKDNNESLQQELHATRKVGLPRYFEMVGRDLWACTACWAGCWRGWSVRRSSAA